MSRRDYQTADLTGAARFEAHNGVDTSPPPEPISEADVAPMAGSDDVADSWFERWLREGWSA